MNKQNSNILLVSNRKNWVIKTSFNKLNSNKKAFTLVELIVVITILAILWTIAFISFQWHSTSARDSKRLSDINNVLKIMSIEIIKWISIINLITIEKVNTWLIVNWIEPELSAQWIPNFQELKINGDDFKDPLTKTDYIFSYIVWWMWTWIPNWTYKFYQAATINENKNNAVVRWDYYEMQSWDSPSIIKNDNDQFVVNDWIILPYDLVTNWNSWWNSWLPIIVNSCSSSPSFLNIWNISEWNPSTENQAWIYSDTPWDCTYSCINWYSWNECLIQPVLTASDIIQNICTANWQIVYTDSIWNEIWRVNDEWLTISWSPWNLTCSWHVVVCRWNQNWLVLQACNVWASAVWATNNPASYWNYYQWWNNWWW
jgi:prepilin-type N-terminal cleavage/methylation domain-containing protein